MTDEQQVAETPETPNTPTTLETPTWLDRARWWVLMFGTTLALIPALMTLVARWWWFAELFTHVRVQYAAGLPVAIVLAALLRGQRQVFLLSLVFVWALTGLIPLYAGKPSAEGTTHRARLLLSNVWTPNPSTAPLVALAAKERPDVLVALETDERWEDALIGGLPDYKYRLTVRSSGHMGATLLSRHPFGHTSTNGPRGSASPVLRAEILMPKGQRLIVYGVHPYPPIRAALARERDAYMAELARRVRAEKHPTIVLGDFNCSTWSPAMQDLMAHAHLRDTRRGFGVQASWPVPQEGLADWIRHIPIDHALISNPLRVTDRRLGPNIGSDHSPVLVDIAW